MRRFTQLLATFLVIGVLAAIGATAQAAPLPSNCTKDKGTVTCTEFSGPGNNQAGVGTTTTTDTQGNTSNFSPAPQDPGTTSSCKPPTSQGNPCNG